MPELTSQDGNYAAGSKGTGEEEDQSYISHSPRADRTSVDADGDGTQQDTLQDAPTDAGAGAEAESPPESRADPAGQDGLLEESNADRFVRWLAEKTNTDSRDAPYQQGVQEQGSRADETAAQIAAVRRPLVKKLSEKP